MKIFFDFEFIEDGPAFVMEPISIGMFREDGAELYREFKDVDWSLANQWVLDNVKPHLYGSQDFDKALRTGVLNSKGNIAKEIIDFAGESPEFWAYFADYDWVILCQLFGRMVDLPKGWPYFCLDIKQYMYHLDVKKEDMNIENSLEHHALADAYWNYNAYNYLKSVDYRRTHPIEISNG